IRNHRMSRKPADNCLKESTRKKGRLWCSVLAHDEEGHCTKTDQGNEGSESRRCGGRRCRGCCRNGGCDSGHTSCRHSGDDGGRDYLVDYIEECSRGNVHGHTRCLNDVLIGLEGGGVNWEGERVEALGSLHDLHGAGG